MGAETEPNPAPGCRSRTESAPRALETEPEIWPRHMHGKNQRTEFKLGICKPNPGLGGCRHERGCGRSNAGWVQRVSTMPPPPGPGRHQSPAAICAGPGRPANKFYARLRRDGNLAPSRAISLVLHGGPHHQQHPRLAYMNESMSLLRWRLLRSPASAGPRGSCRCRRSPKLNVNSPCVLQLYQVVGLSGLSCGVCITRRLPSNRALALLGRCVWPQYHSAIPDPGTACNKATGPCIQVRVCVPWISVS